MRLMLPPDLGRIYRGVGVVNERRRFGGRHGVLQATAWVHVVAADLERLDEAASVAATGDHAALARLRDLIRDEPTLCLLPSRGTYDERAVARCEIGVDDPAAVGVAAHALATRSDGGRADAECLVAFAARRVAAVNLALEASSRSRVGWWTKHRYQRRLEMLSPYALGEHVHCSTSLPRKWHDGGEGGHDPDGGHNHGGGHGHAGRGGGGGHDSRDSHGHRVGDRCDCLDHEPLASALARHWLRVLDLAAAEAATTHDQEVAETSLYERVLDRLDLHPRVRTPSTSTAIAVDRPPRPHTHDAPRRPTLTVTPCTDQVATGEPIHAWVRLDPWIADSHAPVEVLVSDGEHDRRVTLRPETRETLVSFPARSDVGTVTIGGAAPEEGVEAPPVRVAVLRQRATCFPAEGGAWELAHVEAHQQVDACAPARALEDAASRLRGRAGETLTNAYNWGVVGSQLCVQRADTRRCALEREENVRRCVEERDQGYNRCTETRDQGYNACTATRDDGYRRCCDWIPCKWFCDAWVWVSNIVCVAWTWVSNIVCVAWTWVSNVVCVAWEWIKNVVCVAWEVVKAAVCVIANIVVGIVLLVVGLIQLLIAIGISLAGGVVGGICRLIGVRTRDEVSPTLNVVGIHMALLRTGRVLLMSYDEGVYPTDADNPADFSAVADSDRALAAVWDPTTGVATYPRIERNLFCAHHAWLPDGRLLIASGQFPLPILLKSVLPPRPLAPGADADVHVFDPVSETFSRLPDMALGRWYPTCATLPDGRVFIASGTNGYATSPGFGRGIQNTWEIATSTGPTGAPVSTRFRWYHLYPFVHLLTNGLLFTHAKRSTRLLDPSSGGWCRIAPRLNDLDATPGDTRWPFSRSGPGPGTSVLLPLRPRQQDGRWVYPAGRVMILGGGGAEGPPEPEITGEPYELRADTPATRTVEILDLDDADPAWRWAANHMAHGRVMPDSVLLPNGSVLVVGGGRFGKSGGLLAHFASTERGGDADKGALDPVLVPELFDPATETWRPLCPKPIGRLYHTTAMLLADGRVIVAGHDGALNMRPYDRSRYELELFSPPYLFDETGAPAARPVIGTAPSSLKYGEAFTVTLQLPAARFREAALIRPSSLTHQINTDQRYVGLPKIDAGGAAHRTESADSGDVTLLAPPSAAVAPPGWYLLFVLDDAGTPSVGHWVQVQ